METCTTASQVRGKFQARWPLLHSGSEWRLARFKASSPKLRLGGFFQQLCSNSVVNCEMEANINSEMLQMMKGLTDTLQADVDELKRGEHERRSELPLWLITPWHQNYATT